MGRHTLRKLLATAGLLTLTIALALPSGAAVTTNEGPTDGACDASGLLVCAGANAGANVSCNDSPAAAGTCTYTWGWIFTAFSPIGLPGEATFTMQVEIEACVGNGINDVCGAIANAETVTCSFLVGMSCDHNDDDAGATGPHELAPGECLTVTVTATATAEAVTLDEDTTLAGAAYTDQVTNAGQVCNFDNGRG